MNNKNTDFKHLKIIKKNTPSLHQKRNAHTKNDLPHFQRNRFIIILDRNRILKGKNFKVKGGKKPNRKRNIPWSSRRSCLHHFGVTFISSSFFILWFACWKVKNLFPFIYWEIHGFGLQKEKRCQFKGFLVWSWMSVVGVLDFRFLFF